jgi:hypothetical protein
MSGVLTLLNFTTKLLNHLEVLLGFGSIFEVHGFPFGKHESQRLATMRMIGMIAVIVASMSIGLLRPDWR